jgi:uncharacterized RDD family membrane protein YckC
MFFIIGGDGKEYGPVTADQIRAWIAAGRANLDTKAKALGTDEWRRLADFAEFSSPDGAPPVMPAGAGTPAAAPELASHGARIGAALLNAFLYCLAVIPGTMMTAAQLVRQNPDLVALAQSGTLRPENLNLAGLIGTALWVWAGFGAVVLVQILLLTFRGQNIGKLIFGVRVVRADSGQPAGFVHAALLRFLVPLLLMFLLNWIMLLGFVFLLVDLCCMARSDRRCLHDLMAGTKVVKA